ncbi:MAG TPA: aminotransferase class I/II-fold pyridoxal phosphate-dependent enzyme [Aggregatilineaceae bacterium]|jgi:aminotransferase|nr:aminotransferase class I/II-fold pyridoxal phosphate-dependent enzyme [Aggregatilineaceae bacterium]
MRAFVSDRVNAVPPSGIRKFFDIAATMDGVISLGIGEPDFVTPDPILRAGLKTLEQGHTHYTSNGGTAGLRRAISRYLLRLYGIEYNPDTEILVTVGVSEALYLVMNAVLNPGDEVIIPQPSFVAYAPEVMLAGGTPVIIETSVRHEFQVTGAEVEAAVTSRAKAVLLGYPNNPTGAVMTRERLTEIAAVADKHDLLVISDEIYDRLVYGITHTHFATLPGLRPRTVVLSGFSKSHAMTGWRLGYAVGPVELIAAMNKIHQYTIMSAPTMAQFAVADTLDQADDEVEKMRAEYDRRRHLIVSGLNELSLSCFEPRGAFYAFPSVATAGMDEETFADTLLREERVAVVPGTAFGACGAGFVRASYATAYEKIEEALERMHRFMQRHG